MTRQRECAISYVGIVWLVDGKLLIEKVLLSKAESYGVFLTFPRSHFEVWEEYRRAGKVDREVEYETYPRGRITYNTLTESFTLLADKCILESKTVTARIKREMNLPRTTKLETDSHYRCLDCLRLHIRG